MLKLLLDENLPKKLKYRFGEGFDVTTVPERGWSSLKNGELLKAMNEAGIEYLSYGRQKPQLPAELPKTGC